MTVRKPRTKGINKHIYCTVSSESTALVIDDSDIVNIGKEDAMKVALWLIQYSLWANPPNYKEE